MDLGETLALLALLEMSAEDVEAGRIMNREELIERIKNMKRSVSVGVVFRKEEEETVRVSFSSEATLSDVLELKNRFSGIAYLAIPVD